MLFINLVYSICMYQRNQCISSKTPKDTFGFEILECSIHWIFANAFHVLIVAYLAMSLNCQYCLAIERHANEILLEYLLYKIALWTYTNNVTINAEKHSYLDLWCYQHVSLKILVGLQFWRIRRAQQIKSFYM